MADYLFRCLRDYNRAQEELAIAVRSAQQHTVLYSLRLHSIAAATISRRRTRFLHAFALDPRNPNAYNLLADTYVLQRDF